ncbi:MAG: 1-acyl-sn-glycerol-3-phosphate acyltransferase [Myxococcales bacterium]|nr:1-acyl-sn-glycerol-3-phosphate acyltransferase [Myxococcales bacterium]
MLQPSPRRLGAHQPQRSGAVQAAIADLTRRVRDEGVTAVIFPEGTRSKTGAMKPFKTGGLKELVRGAPTRSSSR